MNFILDFSQHVVAWSASLFLLNGLLLLHCSLRQKRCWRSDLAGDQLTAVCGALKLGAARPAVSMFSVLPLPLLRLGKDGVNDEMQVIEGEALE